MKKSSFLARMGPSSTTGRSLAMVAVLAGTIATFPLVHAYTAEAPSAATSTGTLGQSFADLVDRVKPAVVNISTKSIVKTSAPMFRFSPGSPMERQFREFFGQQHPSEREAIGAGSGFIVDPDGYIVTNNHVIDDAKDITVTLHDGTQLKASLVGRDSKTDLALLKVDADSPLPAVEFGDSDTARVGDWVVAVGNPFGLGGTVTAGIISARGRDIQSGPFDDFLQVDAPINRGNSGGPLFDHNGKVIGVNTAIFSPSGGNVGIGFAIPSQIAENIVRGLKDNGRVDRGWIGVSIQEVTDDLAESFELKERSGALVASVGENSPASRAGLSAGDVILSFAGEKIKTMRELPRVVADTPAGKTVPIQVWRGGEQRTLELKVGAMPGEDDGQSLASAASGDSGHTARLGVVLAPLDERDRQEAGIQASDGGVLVSEVAPEGPAARRGLRPGDVILRIGATPVRAPEQVASAVQDADRKHRKQVVLLVRRNGNERFVAVPFDRG